MVHVQVQFERPGAVEQVDDREHVGRHASPGVADVAPIGRQGGHSVEGIHDRQDVGGTGRPAVIHIRRKMAPARRDVLRPRARHPEATPDQLGKRPVEVHAHGVSSEKLDRFDGRWDGRDEFGTRAPSVARGGLTAEGAAQLGARRRIHEPAISDGHATGAGRGTGTGIAEHANLQRHGS